MPCRKFVEHRGDALFLEGAWRELGIALEVVAEDEGDGASYVGDLEFAEDQAQVLDRVNASVEAVADEAGLIGQRYRPCGRGGCSRR